MVNVKTFPPLMFADRLAKAAVLRLSYEARLKNSGNFLPTEPLFITDNKPAYTSSYPNVFSMRIEHYLRRLLNKFFEMSAWLRGEKGCTYTNAPDMAPDQGCF